MKHDEKEKADGKKSKLSGWVRKLNDDQLGAIQTAVAAEMKRRDKGKDSESDPHKMSDRQFEDWKHRIFEESK